MEPTDLTIKILREIRDENRGVRSSLEAFRSEVGAKLDDMNNRFELVDKRFLAVETTLKELAEQMVMLVE